MSWLLEGEHRVEVNIVILPFNPFRNMMQTMKHTVKPKILSLKNRNLFTSLDPKVSHCTILWDAMRSLTLPLRIPNKAPPLCHFPSHDGDFDHPKSKSFFGD